MLSALTGCKSNVENGILDDGQYKVRFENSSGIYEDYELTIDGTEYSKQFKNGQRERGKIEKLYTDKFRLTASDEKEIPLDSLSDLRKSLQHWGPPCFELTGSNGDTLKFRTTFSGQLHISLNTGVLIKRR